jgi:hypothetical protein
MSIEEKRGFSYVFNVPKAKRERKQAVFALIPTI